MSLLTHFLVPPTPDWSDLPDEATYSHFRSEVKTYVQASAPLSNRAWMCPIWLSEHIARSTHREWLISLSRASWFIEHEDPSLPLLQTNPPPRRPLPQISYGIIGSFLTPPMPNLLDPQFYDSFAIEAHWFISAVEGLCKGDWTHPEWELNRILASSWRSFAASYWTSKDAIVILQLNMEPIPSPLGLVYLRAHLIQGPNHTDLLIWDSPKPHTPVHIYRHRTLNPDWAPSNLLFPHSYHPTHFQIYFHSLPSWLPPN